jgi:hypothetical protein
MGHVQTPVDARCAVCHRRDHKSGWQGHDYATPTHIVISLNGARTRLFPVVAGQTDPDLDRQVAIDRTFDRA